ncbi:aminoglycoside phosphotransferase family protein [Candidatus Microgenomates bacterium]|nr:MAG: aminoglycoside phosphotransferase family protein [Candidatus Microgenomates bacterium]
MNTGPLRYNKDIDKKIAEAVEDSLKTKVNLFEKIQKGEFNHVYKVTTDKQKVIIRVFRSGEWPEEDKPMWIEERLAGLNIPHAKILFHTRDSKFFPYGFMITEFIEGKNGWDAITNGKITFEEFQKQLSEILTQIHEVKVDKYGLLKGGKGENSSFTKYKLNKLAKEWEKAKKIENLDQSLYEKSKEIVLETLEKLENRSTPVLIHGDAGPDNSIVTPEGKIILVDWDSAKSSIWFEDYSWMMYWGSHLGSFGPRDERMKKIFDFSNEITTNANFTPDELWQLTKALHIIQAIDLLAYYYIDQKNMEAYKSTKERLTNLLR